MADTAKIPIRGITKLLTNLDPGIRAKLEAAFSEAEAQLDFHNTSTIDSVVKRIPNGKVGAPILTVEVNNLGFDLNWPKLLDRVITMYEVQIATASNFSNAVSYNTVDNFFAVEGASTITYARVRGVRWNGECGPWSNTQTINVAVASVGPVVYSRTINDISAFYRAWPALLYPSPVQAMTITPQRQNGGVMFFGSVGVEFYVDANGFRGHRGNHFYLGTATAIDDSMRVTINGRRVQNLDYIPCFKSPGWVGTPHATLLSYTESTVGIKSPPQSTVFGYSVGFGPGYLDHSAFYLERFSHFTPTAARDRSDLTLADPSSVHVGWLTRRNILNEYIASATSDGSAVYTTNIPLSILGATEVTQTLVCDNYKFNVPSTSIIKGIEAEIFCDADAVLQTAAFQRVRLINSNGVPRPTTKGTGTAFTSTVFGGPTDLWGEAAGFWTPARINSTKFGVDMQARTTYNTNGGINFGAEFRVRGMELTVYTDMNGPELAKISIVYKPRTSNFYSFPYARAVLKNATLNALEFGTEVR